MKIFYSWQLDAPRKTNKDFIHGALALAIGKLSDELNVDEAEREGIELDQDTKGVLGSPDIVRVILDKIAKSNIVVADVSLVAVGKDNKLHINSNVAIELGFSFGKLGDSAVLKIMNTHFGGTGSLPFDLKTRRHPVQYCLPPGSDAETITDEKKKLSNELASILKEYLKQAKPVETAAHPETPSSNKKGAFWQHAEAMVPTDNTYVRRNVYATGSSVLYFRCIPDRSLPILTSREAYDATSELRPLLSEGGYSRARNKWGAVSYCLAHDGDLMGFTQLLKNRELWGVDQLFAQWPPLSEDEPEEQEHYVPIEALLREYPIAIDSMRKVAHQLGYGNDYTVEFGFSGAEGAFLAVPKGFMRHPGPIYDAEVYFRKRVSQEYPTGKLMNEFLEKLFSEVGTAVPSSLLWVDSD